MRIFVVDDDERLVRAVQRSLTGHDVSVETKPSSAIAQVESADIDGEPFDVVVCDLKMPGMTGIDVFARLRSMREPPVLVLMSGDDDVVAPVADSVLVKPFRTGEIVDVVARIKAQRTRTQTRRLRCIPAEGPASGRTGS